MKQKIKNSCFSKMKRVALALFAALCVGSVWGVNAKHIFLPEPTIGFDAANGIATVGGDIQVYPYVADNALRCAISLTYTVKREGEVVAENTVELDEYACPKATTYYGRNKDKDGPYTYQIPSAEFEEYLGSEITVTVRYQLNKTRNVVVGWTWLKEHNNGTKDALVTDFYESSEVFNIAGITGTQATWDNERKVFIVQGEAVGMDKVTIAYKVIEGSAATPSDTSDFSIQEVAVINRAFSIETGYENIDQAVVWTVTADGEETPYQEKIFRQNHCDQSYVIYTWVGNGETEYWNDLQNWSADLVKNHGFPGSFSGTYYLTYARFESDAVVDLNQGSFSLRDSGDALYFAPGLNLVLKNGELGLGCDYTIGSLGSIVEYNNLKLVKSGKTVSARFNLSFAEGSTNIFVGAIAHPWSYLPKYANTKVVFKDGEISTEYSNTSFANLGTHEVEINNAKWAIKVGNCADGAKHGIAGLVKFRDGADRQAQLVVNGKKYLKLNGTYDFVLPATPYANAYVEAGKPNSVEDTFNVRVDASNISGEYKVPLITFSDANNDTTTWMSDVANNVTKLQVVVNGEVVDSTSLNATLVWESNTLYYQQGVAASIGAVKYATLQDAVNAAVAGNEITVIADIVTDGPITVNKQVTVNLNNKTIAATKDAVGDGVFCVVEGGDLTINGDGTVNAYSPLNGWCMAIWAKNGGKVTINGGTYTNVGASSEEDGAHFDLIYVRNGGSVEINGGTFKCETSKWTLNSHNTEKGTFVVKGGKFFGYDPSNFNTDEASVTNWCADGYTVVEGQDADEGYYIVVENPAIAPDGSAEVAADSLDAAVAKVAIKVPDAMKDVVTADKYAEYFVKSAEYNETTGKYTVTAALNPDEVKPVIAETTADDTTKEAFVIDANGNVTLNINNKKPGLYYGVQVLAELGADPEVTVSGLVVPAKDLPEGNAAFFRVVVDFKPFVVPEAE